PDSHLSVGFLDLGSLALRIEQPGATVNIPFVTLPKNRSNVVLQGQNTPFATIRGPFEDMRISAEVLISNSELVFPPNTDNLLSLIYSFRGALAKPAVVQVGDAIPLPFTLDLMVRLMDNVRYITYPTNFRMQRGGFLHITYDGREWVANEANFVSEEGTIDFFGTIFQVENLNIRIIDSQDLIDIKGSFYRRSPRGSVVTLAISTDPDVSKPIFDRLTFTLSSDNPDDTTISKILSRARYSTAAEEDSEKMEGSGLQDQALNLISQNLSTTLVTPFIYPLENTIRRWLGLDNFSINAGFIQNLFMQYSNDPNQLAEYADMDQFTSDITQFSSAILLNNLSISLSKYLGGRVFLDYTLTLQEATDLLNQTKIVTTHYTSLRLFLPWQLRLGYTFKYEPLEDKNLLEAKTSHEIMLQRSFRFWGL
ncbi:MAG: translocation/assembly module TamB, partial [Candidatus Syntrophosphaera sp.]|nr:translocation/assembly module TamB [Candidatus Syntrophosphaera sp.]